MFSTVPLQEAITPHLEELEARRLALVQRSKTIASIVWSIGIFAVIGVSVYAYLIFGEDGGMVGVAVFGVIAAVLSLIIGGIIYAITTGPAKKRYTKDVKTLVYDKALKHYNSSITYDPRGYIEQKTFKKAGLFGSFNRYTGDDLCAGQLQDGRQFRFSELVVEYRSSNNNNSSSTSSTRTVFKGLFYEIELPSSLGAELKIVPDMAESVFGQVGTFMQGMLNKAFSAIKIQDKIVRFDEQYPQFEKDFKIYCSEERIARQFINPTTIAQIYELKREIGDNFGFTIIDNKCYAGVSGKEFLAVDFQTSLTGRVFVDKLEDNLYHCFTMLTALSKIGSTMSNSLPNEPHSSGKNPFQQDSKNSISQKKPSVNYRKSNSKDNPFLL